jgi:hypothetical protein
LRGSIEFKSHIAFVAILVNFPIIITHILYKPSSSSGILLNFIPTGKLLNTFNKFFQGQPGSLYMILFVDFLILFFQVLLINTKSNIRNVNNRSDDSESSGLDSSDNEHLDFDV